MDSGLTGKKVVVSGAARGIGQAICGGFAANGAYVIGVDAADMGETGERLRTLGAGGRWSPYALDLASPQSVREGCAEIMADHPAVDVLVNNAALYGGLKLVPMEQLDLDIWDKVMSVNVRGTYLMVRELLPALKAATGKVVNISSASTLRGTPMLLHYVASKGAVTAMTRSMASELGVHGITVNAVAPGFAATEASKGISDTYDEHLERNVAAQAIHQPLQAGDVVGTVLYLASSWADAVTGQLCVVDYGLNKY
jgi:NAD(P)-dependent dehydrogenase (short-subunit alcohol dehydrogenase family)